MAWEQVASQLNGQTAIRSLAVYDSRLYGGTSGDGYLFRLNVAGNAWEQVAAQLNGQTTIQSLAVYNDRLYGGTSTDGRLFRLNIAKNAWEQVAAQLNGQTAIYSLAVYNDRLYGGTSYGGRLFRLNLAEDAWEQVAAKLDSQTEIYSLAVYNGRLYGGTYPGGRLFRLNLAEDAWEQVCAQLNGQTTIFSLCVLDGRLYGGTYTGGRLFRLNAAGNAWEQVADYLNTQAGIMSLVDYGDRLYGGTYSGGRLFRLNTDSDAWEQSADQLNGQIYIYSLAVFGGCLFGGTYGDGFLFRSDVIESSNIGDGEVSKKCYRVAVKPSQGIGVVEWGIGGDLPFPEAYTGTMKGYNSDGQAISLILDSSSGQFYRVGVKGVFQDKIGAYNQGVEINNMFRIKEHSGIDGSEESSIEHVESHISTRPYNEDYKGESGYTEEGFREGHEVDLKMFANGDTDTPVSKLTKVSQYADIVFGARVEDKRLQLQAEMTTAAYKATRVRQLIQNINKVTPDDTGGVRTENLYQRMFRGQDLWISRDSKHPIMNRATGLDATGPYDSLAEGPDGISNSAIRLVDGTNERIYVFLPKMSVNGVSYLYWVGNAGNYGEHWPIDFYSNPLFAELNWSVDHYKINISLITTLSADLEWDGTGWALLAITSDGTNVYVYENGVLKGIAPVKGGVTECGGYTYSRSYMALGASVFDIRRIPRQLGSEAIQWYYDDVINNNGDGGLLPVMR